MSSITSYSKSDDLIDFLFSHHIAKEREERCFSAFGRHFCARCTGWVFGAFLSLAVILAFSIGANFAFYLLPIPAFIDWGGRRLGFFRSGKRAAVATGFVMGVSLPFFFVGALAFEIITIISAAAYACLYLAISLKS